MVDGAAAKDLIVLGVVLGQSIRIFEGVDHAYPFDRGLDRALDALRRFQIEGVQHGRHHIDGMGILGTRFALGLDACGPVDDEGIGNAATVDFFFPAAERGVACVRPTPRIMVVRTRAAQLVDHLQIFLEILRGEIEEIVLIQTADLAPFGTGAVIGNEHDQRIIQLADLFQEVQNTAEMMVGMGDKTGVNFHHARVQSFFIF